MIIGWLESVDIFQARKNGEIRFDGFFVENAKRIGIRQSCASCAKIEIRVRSEGDT
jgi:hypothetical protein